MHQIFIKRGKEYATIVLSCAIYALAFNWFFQPNNLAFGGFTGVGQIINFLIPLLPVGGLVFVMNVPLFILGIRKMGWRLLFSSVIAMALSSVFIDILDYTVEFAPMEPLLACLYGGGLMGLSMGIMLKVGATTGGTELLARLLKYRFQGISIGKLCLICDGVVILSNALAFQNIDNALYGVVAIYVSSLVMDMTIYGTSGDKMAYIITSRSKKVEKALLDLDLGITVVPARGGYTGEERRVILCAMKRAQIVPLKAAVSSLDEDAFVIVCDTHEVLGRRFGSYSPDDL